MAVILLVTVLVPAVFSEEKSGEQKPDIKVTHDLGKAMMDQAAQVGDHLGSQAATLFRSTPLGFDRHTVVRTYESIIRLPLYLPDLVRIIMEQSRLLGFVGSILILGFLAAILYALIGQKRVLLQLEGVFKPLEPKLPGQYYPWVLAILQVVAASLFPLILYGMYSLVRALTAYEAGWFVFIGHLFHLWFFAALIITGLRELLIRGLIPMPDHYARTLFRILRFITLYIIFTLIAFHAAKSFRLPDDMLALLKFAISLSVVFMTLFLLIRKKAILGILPELPYASYRIFTGFLKRMYFPIMVFTFLTGILWCFGFKDLSRFLWMKTWAVVGVFLGIIIIFHNLQGFLKSWIGKKQITDEAAHTLYRSLRTLLIFVTVTFTFVLTLQLLGLFYPLQSVISFPILIIGDAHISLWTLIKATMIILLFIYMSQLLRSYLDYRIFPALGLDEGLAYSISMFINYSFVAFGLLFALRSIGLDLRVFMIFAGAVGIGIGLQNMASNFISGFMIIFGRRIKKGDWIQIGDRVGAVQGVNLRVVTVKTLDNIEYLIPNSEITSGTITNYTLSDPLIRVHVPVGVSYQADPKQVSEILENVAQRNPDVSRKFKPVVWFKAFGESSLDFELLAWMDIRKMSENQLRSDLYFVIFDELAKAGIEIPYPQQDVHFRSGWPPGWMGSSNDSGPQGSLEPERK